MASSGVTTKKYWIIEVPLNTFDYQSLKNYLKNSNFHAIWEPKKMVTMKRRKKIIKLKGVYKVHFLSERTAVRAWGFYNI